MGSSDDAFNNGMGFGFGAGYDRRSRWDGPVATRGVMRGPSRVERDHPDEHEIAPDVWVDDSRGPVQRRGYPAPAGYQARPYGEREEGWYARGEHGSRPGWSETQRHDPYARGGYGMREESLRGRPNYGPPPGYDPRGEGGRFGAYPAPVPQERWGHGMHGTDMGFGDREEIRGPHYGKGPKGYTRSDDRIRDEVCEVLSRQGHIDASDVEIFVENRQVRLVGTVTQRSDKRNLEMMVERVHGVDEVHNELRLRRPENAASPAAERTAASQRTPSNGRNAQS